MSTHNINKRVTLEFEYSDSTKQHVQFDLPFEFNLPDPVIKQSYSGDASVNMPKSITLGNFNVGFVAGSSASTGLTLSTVNGAGVAVRGFHWCLYGAGAYANYILATSLNGTPLPIPDTGITEEVEWRKLWWMDTNTSNDSVYYVELFKRGNKIIIKAWIE